MNKERYRKCIEKKRLLYKGKPCENCGKDHDHSYGTGRFCSKQCKNEFVGKQNHINKSPKVKAHLDKLRQLGKIKSRSPHGTWKCCTCNLIFDTKAQLKQHFIDKHGCSSEKTILIKTESGWQCPYCDKEFEKRLSASAHLAHCKNHPNNDSHEKSAVKQGQTYSKRYHARLYPKAEAFHSHPQSKETIQKIMRTFENRASRGEYSGYYKGYYYECSYELAWVVYNLDHNVKFNRCRESFEYYDSETEKWRLYFPDFEMPDGTIVEIKGYYTRNTMDKMQAVTLDYGRNIRLLEEKDLQTELSYCRKKYGKDFASTLKLSLK